MIIIITLVLHGGASRGGGEAEGAFAPSLGRSKKTRKGQPYPSVLHPFPLISANILLYNILVCRCSAPDPLGLTTHPDIQLVIPLPEATSTFVCPPLTMYCMYSFLYMHVLCIYMYSYIQIYIHAVYYTVYVRKCVRMAYAHTCTYLVHDCSHVRMYMYMHACMHACTLAQTHAPTHAHK